MKCALGSPKWNYMIDSDGKRIPSPRGGILEVPVHESRAYVNATLLTEREEQEEIAVREARAQERLERLNAEERAVLELHEGWRGSRTVTETIPRSELEQAYRDGWSLCEGDRDGKGTVKVAKSYATQLGYDEIGERLGLSTRQVHSRIVSAHRKLRR